MVRFEEDTPRQLMEALPPDVLMKGGDYESDEVVGGREVIAAGGEVVIAPLVPGRSTTNIINKTSREKSDDE